MKKLLLFSVLALFSVQNIYAEEQALVLKSPVTDLTGTLSSAEQETLRSTIGAFEAKTGSQVAVLIVASTKPDDIAPYAHRVFQATGLGRKGIDDGVLLVVAKDDRNVRIEVGRGLEGALPDISAWRIIKEFILPRFKEGSFFTGISDGVAKIIDVASGEKLPEPAPQSQFIQQFGDQAFPLAFMGIVAGIAFSSVFGKRTGALIGALFVGGITALYNTLAALIVALIVYILIRIITFINASSWGGGGFHSYGGGGGDFGSGGGFGGGGWSGGGGSSSGGGASGSW
jgi:uncharacterized protein